LKVLSKPRHWLFGAALLLTLMLTSCGEALAGDSWPGISSDGSNIYVAYKDQVFRVNPTGGNETIRHINWLARAPNGGVHMYAAPALGPDGMVYVGAYDKKIYKFSLATGFLSNWNSPTGTERVVGAALVKDNLVYVPLGDKGIQALDTETGQLKFSFASTTYGVWSQPVLVGDTLYFSSLDHHVYALNASDLTLKWKVDVGGAAADSPLVDGDTLYIGTFANELIALSTDGKIVNRFATENWVWSTPILQNDTLYFGDLGGYVYALGTNDWQQKWKVQDTERPGAIRGRVAFAHIKHKTQNEEVERDVIIAGSKSKYIRAYDAQNGEVVWTSAIAADEQILSDLIVIGNDVIYTTLHEEQIVGAFNINSGNRSWVVNLKTDSDLLKTPTAIPAATSIPSATPASTTASTAAPTSAQ
jgi:outer membrane protein assembly factor BamB